MALALVFVFHALPAAGLVAMRVHIAGSVGKMKIVDFSPRMDTRTPSGRASPEGCLSPSPTSEQISRRCSATCQESSLTESRLDFCFNGLVKMPMQFFILLVGLMVFVFYQFHQPPIFFHTAELAAAKQTARAQLTQVESDYSQAFLASNKRLRSSLPRVHQSSRPSTSAACRAEPKVCEARGKALREDAKRLIHKARPRAETKDADYIFITFVKTHFPPSA
jgi:SSS family solute:Na+ symporter